MGPCGSGRTLVFLASFSIMLYHYMVNKDFQKLYEKTLFLSLFSGHGVVSQHSLSCEN